MLLKYERTRSPIDISVLNPILDSNQDRITLLNLINLKSIL